MTNEKPASPTTTAKGVTEALHSCICLLETMAESAQARDDHAEWAMMSVMAANCRGTLEAALSLPASPTQGELAVKALIELIDAPLTYDWNGHKDMEVQSIEQPDDLVAGRVRMLMRQDWNHEEICTLARDRIMGLSKRLAEVRAALSALDRTTLPPTEDMVLVPKTALDWLFGEGPDDDGIWFGDAERVAGSGAFWWRTVFRRLISGRLALTSGSKPE